MSSHSFKIALVLTLVVTLSIGASGLRAQEPETGTSRLRGRVFAADGKQPLAGATVLAYHLSTEQVFRSEPTSHNGQFEIDGLPLGYYDLAVETADGLFAGSDVINLPPAGKAEVNLIATPFDVAGATAGEPRPFPGATSASEGVVRVERRMTQREFWRSPKGVAILAGAGAVALVAIATSSKEDSVSPFQGP